jgi:hypothetical protein
MNGNGKVLGWFTFDVHRPPHAEDIANYLNSIVGQMSGSIKEFQFIPCYSESLNKEAIVIADFNLSEKQAVSYVENDPAEVVVFQSHVNNVAD